MIGEQVCFRFGEDYGPRAEFERSMLRFMLQFLRIPTQVLQSQLEKVRFGKMVDICSEF